MKKYVVTTYANAEWQYIVEADSKEEVEEKVWAGDYEELNNGDPTNVQDEQIESMVELPITERFEGALEAKLKVLASTTLAKYDVTEVINKLKKDWSKNE
jgi:hypothetical protein